MWRWRGGAARRALRQRTLQSDCSHKKTRPFGILESSCGRCGLVESPQPPERNTKTLPTLYPYPIFSSLRRSPRVRRTSTGAKSRAVGSAGINAGCPQGGRVENWQLLFHQNGHMWTQCKEDMIHPLMLNHTLSRCARMEDVRNHHKGNTMSTDES